MGSAVLLPVMLFVSIGTVALFTFISIASWSNARRREREAFYKTEMLKKLTESEGPGTASVLEVLREQQRNADLNRRHGLRIGGLVTFAVGAGLMIFLRALLPGTPIYLCGLMPVLIGVALYAASLLPSPKEWTKGNQSRFSRKD